MEPEFLDLLRRFREQLTAWENTTAASQHDSTSSSSQPREEVDYSTPSSFQPREEPDDSTSSSPQLELNTYCTYTHPIHHGRQFWLIYLLPAHEHRERLECSCQVFDIGEAPPYGALSYVWGEKRPPVNIVCNGRTIGIQPSLETALKRLRLQDSTRIIWVDAVCINQSDNAEKNHQVSLKGSIYSMARGVVIWLGHVDPLVAEAAFRCLKIIAFACLITDMKNSDQEIRLHKYASLVSASTHT